MSTIKEVKEDRAKMEKLITDLLRAFEEKHEVQVTNIDMDRSVYMGSSLTKLHKITLEVKV